MADFEQSLDVEVGENFDEITQQDDSQEDLDLDADDVLLGCKRIFHLPFQPIWYYFMLLVAVFQIYLCIYEAGFRKYGRADGLHIDFTVVKHVSSAMYAIDILLLIGCRTISGLQISPSKIRRPNWVLLADFISILPIELLIPMHHPISPLKAKLYYVVQLHDCLKIVRVYHTFYYIHHSVGTSKVPLQIFEYYFSMGVAIMIGFVMTYQIMCLDVDCEKAPTPEQYFTCIYQSVSKVTARGITLYPNNLFWMLAMAIIGFIVFLAIIGSSMGYVTIALHTSLVHRYDFLNKLKVMNIACKKLNVPKCITKKNMDFFDRFWKKRSGYSDANPDYLQVMPQSMYEEISLDISWYALKHSQFLRNMDIPFLRHVATFVQSKFILPGEVIYNKNCTKNMMIYVVSGIIQILSEEDDDTPIFSLSAGTCLGESSLFFNCKPKSTVRSKTVCSLHVLKAKNFIKLMKLFPQQFFQLRKAFKERLAMAQRYHALSNSINHMQNIVERTDYITIMWLKATLHRLMTREGDTSFGHQCHNIFLRDEFDEEKFVDLNFSAKHLDMLVISERLELISDTVFMKTSCPCVFQPASVVLNSWEGIIMLFAIVNAFVVPYFALVEPNIPLWYEVWVYIITTLWVLDLYVQISTAVKKADVIVADVVRIFLYRMGTPPFLTDLFSSIPLEFMSSIIIPKISPQYCALLHLNRVVKIWRVHSIFKEWEQQLNVNLILIRYIKYCSLLCFMTYLCSCLMFSFNCFDHNCRFYTASSTAEQLLWCCEITIHILTGVSVPSRLYDKSMYYPVFLWLTLLSTALFVFICGSVASEYALQRASKIKLAGILTDIISLIKSKALSTKYNNRIFEYVETQWTENCATNILYKRSPFADLPLQIYGLLKETIYKDTLLNIPLFQELSDKVMLDICKVMSNSVLPPNEVVCYAGDIRCTFYIIVKGYCKVISNGTGAENWLLGPGQAISVLETHLRLPVMYTVVTVTHCRLVIINYDSLEKIYLTYHEHQKEVKTALEEADVANKLETMFRSSAASPSFARTEEAKSKKSFRKFGYNIEADSFEEYDYYIPFDRLGFLSFVQYFLLRYTILPESKFLLRWEMCRCVCAVLSALLFTYTGTGTCIQCDWYFLLALLDGMAWIDIYLRFHVGYYNEDGILISHPLKTAIYYIQHGFIADFIGVFPVHLFFPMRRRHHNKVLSLLQLNRILQMYRYIGFFNYIETKTFLPTRVLHIVKYFPITLIICVCVGSVVINAVCEFSEEVYNSDNEIFTKGVNCLSNTWITRSPFQKPLSPARVQLYAVYFATSIMTLAGMTGFEIRSTVIAVLGLPLAFMSYILNIHIISTAIAHYTTGNSALMEYQESMEVVHNFMSNFKVKADLQKKLIAYFELKWRRKRGREIHESINRFNRSLQQDILYDVYGQTLEEASLFTGDSQPFLRNLLLQVSHDVSTNESFIITVNDITQYLHILYKGKLGVLAPDGSRLATLTPGSMFGNLDDYDMTRQTVSVIALGHVEILSIESLRFHEILSYYPRLQKQFKQRIAIHVDYIESKKWVASEVDLTYHTVSSASASKNPFAFILNAVFLPEKMCIQIWQALILIGVCYIEVSFGFYQMAMAEFAVGFIIFQYVCDLLFAIDYYIKSHTAYENEAGMIVTDLKLIQKHRFQNRVAFWFDIISMIPFDVLAWVFPSMFRVLYPALRANRSFRFVYVLYHFKNQKQKLARNLNALRFTYIIVWSTFILHICTCIMIAISCTHSYSIRPEINCNVTSLSSFQKLKIYATYISIVVSCFITTSSSSAYPESSLLIVYCILMMIFLQMLNATFLSQIYSTIRRGYHRQNKYAQYLNRIRNFMEREQLSGSLYTKAYEYLTFLWRWRKGTSYPRLLKEAPTHLREPILNSAFANHINNHVIFEKCHTDFNRQIVSYLRNEMYFRDDYIVFQGAINQRMYFIDTGEVSVLTEDSTFQESIVQILKPGMSFGIAQGLSSNKPHSYTFRANKTTVILVLQFDKWSHLLRFFPASKTMIRTRYAQFGDKYV